MIHYRWPCINGNFVINIFDFDLGLDAEKKVQEVHTRPCHLPFPSAPPPSPVTLWHYWLNRWWGCWGGEILHPTIRSEPPVTPRPLPSWSDSGEAQGRRESKLHKFQFHDFKTGLKSHLALWVQTSVTKFTQIHLGIIINFEGIHSRSYLWDFKVLQVQIVEKKNWEILYSSTAFEANQVGV